jgi:hypothetical protein
MVSSGLGVRLAVKLHWSLGGCSTMSQVVTIAHFSGTGRIFRNGELALHPVDYEITISQEMIRVRSHQGDDQLPGLKRLEGTIYAPVPFSLVGEPIELELEDGRRWKCFIQSSRGNLVNMGGIQ